MPDIRVNIGGSVAILSVGGAYEPGSQPPATHGYMDMEEWWRVQRKAGLKQVACGRCGRWKFPQELSATVDKSTAHKRDGTPVPIESPVCNGCNSQHPRTDGGGHA
ncbi:hypothetical protein D3C86_410830 [compost metagenome]